MGSKHGGAQANIMSIYVVKYVKKTKLYSCHCDSKGQCTRASVLSPLSNIVQNHNEEDHNSAYPGWLAGEAR